MRFLMFCLLCVLSMSLLMIENDQGVTLVEAVKGHYVKVAAQEAPEAKVKIPTGIDPGDEEYWELAFQGDISDQVGYVCAHGTPYFLYRGQLVPLPEKKKMVYEAYAFCKKLAREKAEDD